MLPFFKKKQRINKSTFLGVLREDPTDSDSASDSSEPEEMPKELDELNNTIVPTKADIYRISWCDYKIVTRVEGSLTSLGK